jgi:plastocyanin
MNSIRLRSPIVLLVVVLVAITPAAIAAQYPTAESEDTTGTSGVTVLASGLTNPRGFTWGTDGTMFLATGGEGGDTQVEIEATPLPFFVGPTASIVSVTEGCPVPLAEGIPSLHWTDANWTWGAMDVAIFNGELYALLGGSGGPDMPNGIYRVLGNGTLELFADLGTWNAENPTEELAWDDDPAGSWFDLEAGPNGLWATEAVRGRVVTVTPEGQISQFVDLSAGHMVPTGLALDGEGGAYVGFETTTPFPDGASKVVHVAADGTVTDHWTGLTAVTDVVLGPDGVLYAAEMATNNTDEPPHLNPGTGRVVRQTGPDSLEEVVTGIDYPVYLGFDASGMLILTTPAFGPDKGVGYGMVLQVDTASAPVSLEGFSGTGPACETPADTTTSAPADPAGTVTTAVTTDVPTAVTIQDFAFVEGIIEVPVGTTVTWTNNDTSPHTVTSVDGTFDSGRLDTGQTFSFTFSTAGEFAYLCEFHPGMQGTVVVTG